MSERETKFSAPRADFGATLNHLLAQLQRRLVFEHNQTIIEHERQFHETLEKLRQENTSLRVGRGLPQEGSHQAMMWPPPAPAGSKGLPTSLQDWPLEGPTPRRHVGEYTTPRRHVGESSASQDVRLREAGTAAESRTLGAAALAKALPQALRTLADEQDKVLEALVGETANAVDLVNQGCRSKGSSHSRAPQLQFQPFEPNAGGEAAIASMQNEHQTADQQAIMDTNLSVMVTAGAQSNLADYQKFELWPSWKEEYKSYADKINDHCALRFTQKFDISNLELVDTRCRYLVMSPSSSFFLFWNALFLIFLIYELLMLPMIVFTIPKSMGLSVWQYSAIIFWTCDFLLAFSVGFYGQDGGVVMNRLKIFVHYAKSWMFPDLLILVTDWLLISDVGGDSGGMSSILRASKSLRYLRILRVLRVLRVRKMREVMHRIDDMCDSQYTSIFKSIVLNLGGLVLMSHFIGCLWYFIGEGDRKYKRSWVVKYGFEGKYWFEAYLASLHWSLTQFTPGSMDVQPQGTSERACAVVVLLFGMIFFSSIVSSINSATNTLKNMNAKYDRQVSNVRRYFKEQNISQQLTQRVLRYADTCIRSKSRKVAQSEVDMLHMLPQGLYMDVMLEIYDQYLERNPFLQALLIKSRTIVKIICCTCLREVFLSAGDELFGPGEICGSMYFVVSGALTYSEEHINNKDQVEAGTWFCEAVLWTPWVHQGTMSSNVESELLSLDSAKFREVMSKFHGDMWLPQKYATEFVDRMNQKAGFDNNDPSDDVKLSDLLTIDTAVELLSRVLENSVIESSQGGL